MTTRKTAATAASGVQADAWYRVTMLRVLPTPAFVYRPEDQHRMTGAQLEALAKIAESAPTAIATFEKLEG